MDINKVKEAIKIHYNKKELELLYWQAKARDIKKKELKDIKKCLYEIVPIGQFSPSTFMTLIKILKILPEKALKSIKKGDFINIYNKIAKIKNYYKGDFTHCNNLLLLLYTDYKNINNILEFDNLANLLWNLNYIGHEEEIFDLIFNFNPNLAYIIEDAKRYCEFTSKLSRNINARMIRRNIDSLFNSMQITLLMHIELFNYQYSLPTDIALFLYENIEITYKTILKFYNECQDKYQFSKILLLEFLNTKNKNFNNISLEQLNQKTRKLLKEKN